MGPPMVDAATPRTTRDLPQASAASVSESRPGDGRQATWSAWLDAEGIPREPASHGRAVAFLVASVEPTTGDPDLLAVTPAAEATAWWVDRQTMRCQRVPEDTHVAEADVVRAADLGDRVQLALGEPVLVRVGLRGPRLVVEGVEPLAVRSAFTGVSYRRLAPLIAGSSTLAPLAIDAIDRALRLDSEPGEPRVRRLYGRAYRRIDERHAPPVADWAQDLGVLERGLRLGRDVARFLRDVRGYRIQLRRARAEHPSRGLSAMPAGDLIRWLHRDMALVTQGLSLLEQARLSTLSLLPMLEAAAGPIPRAAFDALAAPIVPRARRAIDAQLVAMAHHCRGPHGQLVYPSGAAVREWIRLRGALGGVRMLGVDVRPEPMGSSDRALLDAIEEAMARAPAGSRARRRRAERALLAAAVGGPFGPMGAPLVAGQLLLLRQVSRAKGGVADDLSGALLYLRAAALAAGERLREQGVIDAAEDALYMPLDEIHDALSGELGGYAARVRLRREDDRRFRSFDAPARVHGIQRN